MPARGDGAETEVRYQDPPRRGTPRADCARPPRHSIAPSCVAMMPDDSRREMILRDIMGLLRTTIAIENPLRPGVRHELPEALVDGGAELTWAPVPYWKRWTSRRKSSTRAPCGGSISKAISSAGDAWPVGQSRPPASGAPRMRHTPRRARLHSWNRPIATRILCDPSPQQLGVWRYQAPPRKILAAPSGHRRPVRVN